MPDRPSTNQRVTRVGRGFIGFGVAVALLSSCTSSSSSTAGTRAAAAPSSTVAGRESRLVLGHPEPGLQFTVSNEPGVTAGPSVFAEGSGAAEPALIKVTSATDAAAQFGQAVVDGRVDDAFALLATDERGRVGSALRFRELLSEDEPWQSMEVVAPGTGSVGGGDVVALRVTHEPGLDEIHGLTAPSVIVQLPVIREGSSWRVRWERRRVESRYAADEARLQSDVTAWVADRQRSCGAKAPNSEYAGGLLGVVGLANALCRTTAPPTVAAVGDIYTLDDPQPLLDAFGSASFDWARVVSLSAPTPMDVIAAPVGDRWLVVGVAPSRLPAA
jgi:hypothetical protein